MKLIIYLFEKVVPLFLGAMLFFALVLNLVDLFMHIANYLQNNCSVKDILSVMALYVPKTIWYSVPVAILFSTSYVLSDMYANNEIEALLASGVSLFKFTLPLLTVSFVMAFGLFLFEDNFVVQTYEKKVSLQNKLLQKSESENNYDIVVISENGKLIYISTRYIGNQKKLKSCYFIFRDENKVMQSVIFCPTAVWNEKTLKWDLENAVQYEPDGNGLKMTQLSSTFTDRLTESYEIFKKSNVDVQSVTANEAKIYIEHLRKAGLPYNEELSEYYKKFAFYGDGDSQYYDNWKSTYTDEEWKKVIDKEIKKQETYYMEKKKALMSYWKVAIVSPILFMIYQKEDMYEALWEKVKDTDISDILNYLHYLKKYYAIEIMEKLFKEVIDFAGNANYRTEYERIASYIRKMLEDAPEEKEKIRKLIEKLKQRHKKKYSFVQILNEIIIDYKI